MGEEKRNRSRLSQMMNPRIAWVHFETASPYVHLRLAVCATNSRCRPKLPQSAGVRPIAG